MKAVDLLTINTDKILLQKGIAELSQQNKEEALAEMSDELMKLRLEVDGLKNK